MKHSASNFKQWMDARGLSASDVAPDLGTEEQTIRKWRSVGVPDRRVPYVERYMAEWTPPGNQPMAQDANILRIPFTDEEMDEISEASRIVDCTVRDFVKRSAIHQARSHGKTEGLRVAQDEKEYSRKKDQES